MKKKLLLIFAIVSFIFSFTACTVDEQPEDDQTAPAQNQENIPENNGDMNDDNLEGDTIDDVDDAGEKIIDDVENADDEVENIIEDTGENMEDDNTNQ